VHTDSKITHTDKGSHGPHWYTIFDEKIDKKACVIKAFEIGEKLYINDSLSIMTNGWMRGVITNNFVVTGFPYIKSFKYEKCELASIIEWSHSKNLEAIIKVSHESGCGLAFFATDYAFNKNNYKDQKNLSINIVGLVYEMYEFDVKELNEPASEIKFSEDYCGYFPCSEDEIDFIGRIQDILEYFLDDIAGYLITVKITPDFGMNFFIAHTNLSIELEKNKLVRGIAWVQGTLEK